jgi:hypothetical protein
MIMKKTIMLILFTLAFASLTNGIADQDLGTNRIERLPHGCGFPGGNCEVIP